MLLKTLEIKNFRGIKHLTLHLDELCVLIGDNNTGKTSVLEALRLCMTHSFSRTRRSSIFDQYDYHLPHALAQPIQAEPIEITLTFAEGNEEEWDARISQQLVPAEQFDTDGKRVVIFRVTSGYDAGIRDFVTDFDFLNILGDPIPNAKNPRHFNDLQKLVPTFYLSSLRDAAQEFRSSSTFWRPFIRALKIDDENRTALEASLSQLNQEIIDQHSDFDHVKKSLRKAANLTPLDRTDPVLIEALPSRVFEVLSRTRVILGSQSGARVPIHRHGSGTQSIAVMCLFDAFLKGELGEGYSTLSEPLLALEEPEAHLHPAAIKAVSEMLKSLSGQKIISTHSGELLASIPLRNIRRLQRIDGQTQALGVEQSGLSEFDIGKLDHCIRSTRGSLLFASSWLLVEGETEAVLLPECARAMGCDLYADRVACIEYAQVGLGRLLTLADYLGIQWFVLADHDSGGDRYIKTATQHLGSRKRVDHVKVLDHGSMELFLCREGFGSMYEESVTQTRDGASFRENNSLEYWQQVLKFQKKGSKTQNIRLVAEQIGEAGIDRVPELLRDVIERVRKLARTASDD